MDSSNYKSILEKFDEVSRFENPSNFNYMKLVSQVKKLKSELEQVFKLEFVIDDQVQDASFYCDLIIPDALITNKNIYQRLSIQISNFGSLATLNYEKQYLEGVKPIIIKALSNTGFIFLESADLDDEYDGNFKEFAQILGVGKVTWRTRYFDYL
jgi:hypothetical protein